jgi:hypothetical protein
MNVLKHDSQILKFWKFVVCGFLEKIANSQVGNMWNDDTRPTSASDFFRLKIGKFWLCHFSNFLQFLLSLLTRFWPKKHPKSKIYSIN